MQHKQGFQMHALLGAYPPLGDCNNNRPINPSINVVTDNTDPYGADRREQDPIGVVESHLSRNFSKKFWGSLDLRVLTDRSRGGKAGVWRSSMQ